MTPHRQGIIDGKATLPTTSAEDRRRLTNDPGVPRCAGVPSARPSL